MVTKYSNCCENVYSNCCENADTLLFASELNLMAARGILFCKLAAVTSSFFSLEVLLPRNLFSEFT